MRVFAVPYFVDAGITNIVSPTGWSYAISNSDWFQLGNGAETLIWTAAPGYEIASSRYIDVNGQVVLSPLGVLDGFGYEAQYAGTKGPYEEIDTRTFTYQGDPLLPASPDAIAAGLPPLAATVAEPSSAVLAALGLAVLALTARRRKV